MAISPLLKINVVGFLDSKDMAINAVQDIGTVHIHALSGEPRPSAMPTGKLQHIAQLIDGLGKFRNKRTLISGLAPSKLILSGDKTKQIISTFKYQEVWERYSLLQKRIHRLDEEDHSLKTELSRFQNWKLLNIEIEKLKTIKTAVCILGTIPYTMWQRLSEKADELRYCSVQTISESKYEKHIFFVFHKEIETAATELLKTCEFAQFNPAITGTIPAHIETCEKRLLEIPYEKQEIIDKLTKLTRYIPQLLCIYDYYRNTELQTECGKETLNTKTTFIIEGWIKKTDLLGLQKKLAGTDAYAIPVLAAKGETPPVALQNKKIFKPFEIITNLYGMPARGEIDPTPVLAPFFLIFFAICLTDAGYGLTLAGLAYLGLKKLKVGETGKLLLKLMVVLGLGTIVIGLLTGGIFGIDFSHLGNHWEWAKAVRAKIMLLDPIKNPMAFLLVALGLGFIQIWFGIFLHMLENFKMNRFADGILDQVPLLAITLGLLLFSLTTAGYIPKGWKTPSIAAVYTGMLTLILFQGRASKNIFARIFIGFYGLYGIIGLVGDLLSYSRLLALGLATGILAMVVNIIGGLVLKIPLVGPVFMLAVLVAGHLFVIAINALGGFIHCTRLQFVEFFTKFYQGGSEIFKPFKKEYKYIIINS